MLKIVLWAAVGCVVLLAALGVSRVMGDRAPKPAAEVVAESAPVVASAPVAEAAPAVAPVALPPPPKPMDVDPQIADDAAAVGMTTREPEGEAAPH